jgi:hypothetical protein
MGDDMEAAEVDGETGVGGVHLVIYHICVM